MRNLSIFIENTDKPILSSENKRTLSLRHQPLIISIKLVITYKFHPIRDRLEIIMAQLGYKFIMAPGISHDKHLGIETLEVRKLTERILNIRRMLYLKETIGHHHLAAQRIRLKPHNVYRATPIHEFLIGEWRNFRQCGDFAQLHIDTSPDSADRMLHIHPTSSRSLLQLRIVSYLAKFYFV